MGKRQKEALKFRKNEELISQKNSDPDDLENQFTLNRVKIILKGQQWNEKNLKIKRGRPSKSAIKKQNQKKDQQVILKYNEIDLIKNHFIKYMYSIGYPQGLVFSTKQRQILKDQQLSIEQPHVPTIYWDSQHTWNKQQQMSKILQITQKQKIFDSKSNINSLIYQHLLNIGDIFPRQITSQIYRFLCRIFLLAMKYRFNQQFCQIQQKQELKKFMEKILTHKNGQINFIFLNGKFSNQLKIQYPQKLTRQLQKLCHNVLKLIKQLIK